MTDEPPSIDTLGRHLDDQARRIAARRLPVYPWARPFEVLFDHLTSLPALLDGRFERRESALAGAEPDIGRPGKRGASPGETDARGLPAIYASQAEGRPLPSNVPAVAGQRDDPADRPAEGRPLPSDVQGRLREVTGRGAEALRVHDDAAADAVARAHRADAVTVGPDVFFRQGQFQPREPRGFGLLVHEATHVLELLQPGAAWRRATGDGVHQEEAAALAQERAAVAGSAPAVAGSAPAVGKGRVEAGNLAHPLPQPAAPGAAPRSAPPASPALRPMTAAADRDMSAPPPAPMDLEALRRSLVDDLMRQLRTEFERGG